MTSIEEKFNTLASLVREARVADAEALEAMETAKAKWKEANEILTDRMRVLDAYLNQVKTEAISK